ncbi:MAG: hypothetical protein ACOC9N_02695 [Gemmatimonadota bacterium]
MNTFEIVIVRRSLAAAAVAALFAALVAAGPLAAQQHEHAEGGDHTHAGEPHFVHPLVAESVSPDTKMRLDYGYLDPGAESELELEGEYAFHPSVSVELGVHYDPGAAALGDTHLLLKLVNYAFAERGVLLGSGLSLNLPTGDDGGHAHGGDPAGGDEVGHTHAGLYEFAPFLNAGVMIGDLELVGWTRFRIPTNQSHQEDVETSVGYNISALYHLGTRVQALLELDGSGGLSGPATARGTSHLTPGVKVRPFTASSLAIGLGVGIPLTDDRDFDTRTLVSAFYHF